MNNVLRVVIGVALFLVIGTVLSATHHQPTIASPYVSTLSPTAVTNAAACDPFPLLKCVNTTWAAGCMSTTFPDTCVKVNGPVPKCQNELCS